MENTRKNSSKGKGTWYQKDYTRLESVFDAAVERSRRKKIIHYASDRLYSEDSKREMAKESFKTVAWAESLEEKDIHTEIINLANDTNPTQMAPPYDKKDLLDLLTSSPFDDFEVADTKEESTSSETIENPDEGTVKLADLSIFNENFQTDTTELSESETTTSPESTASGNEEVLEETDITSTQSPSSLSNEAQSFIDRYYQTRQEVLSQLRKKPGSELSETVQESSDELAETQQPLLPESELEVQEEPAEILDAVGTELEPEQEEITASITREPDEEETSIFQNLLLRAEEETIEEIEEIPAEGIQAGLEEAASIEATPEEDVLTGEILSLGNYTEEPEEEIEELSETSLESSPESEEFPSISTPADEPAEVKLQESESDLLSDLGFSPLESPEETLSQDRQDLPGEVQEDLKEEISEPVEEASSEENVLDTGLIPVEQETLESPEISIDETDFIISTPSAEKIPPVNEVTDKLYDKTIIIESANDPQAIESAQKDLQSTKIAFFCSVAVLALYAIIIFPNFMSYDYIALTLCAVGIFTAWDVKSKGLITMCVIILLTVILTMVIWVYRTQIQIAPLHYGWFFIIPLCLGSSYAFINNKRYLNALESTEQTAGRPEIIEESVLETPAEDETAEVLSNGVLSAEGERADEEALSEQFLSDFQPESETKATPEDAEKTENEASGSGDKISGDVSLESTGDVLELNSEAGSPEEETEKSLEKHTDITAEPLERSKLPEEAEEENKELSVEDILRESSEEPVVHHFSFEFDNAPEWNYNVQDDDSVDLDYDAQLSDYVDFDEDTDSDTKEEPEDFSSYQSTPDRYGGVLETDIRNISSVTALTEDNESPVSCSAENLNKAGKEVFDSYKAEDTDTQNSELSDNQAEESAMPKLSDFVTADDFGLSAEELQESIGTGEEPKVVFGEISEPANNAEDISPISDIVSTLKDQNNDLTDEEIEPLEQKDKIVLSISKAHP